MKFLCLLLFISFSIQAQVVTYNPFSNKAFQWDGTKFTNALDANESYSVFFSDAPNFYQPPVAISANRFAVTTNLGEIFIIDLERESAELFFKSKDKCSSDLAFSGCIYSLTTNAEGKIIYLLHERDGSDSLMIEKNKLVTNIPGPSGPIWIRPNGNLGLLPYGHGIYEITLPKQPSDFSEVLVSSTPVQTMAGAVQEGLSGDGSIRTYIFDFSTVKLFQGDNKFATFANAYTVSFDPCFGNLWFVDEQGVDNMRVTPNPAACPLTLQWDIESKSSPKGSQEKEAHRFWDFPRGTEYIPNSQVFSLGYLGQLTLVPNQAIYNAEGTDLRIFENAFISYATGDVFAEVAQVELFDGEEWVSTGCDCNNPEASVCAGMQVTTVMPGDGTLPWSEEASGLGIDLADFGINKLEKIRLLDCGTAGDTGASGGFDLDAIAVNPASL